MLAIRADEMFQALLWRHEKSFVSVVVAIKNVRDWIRCPRCAGNQIVSLVPFE